MHQQSKLTPGEGKSGQAGKFYKAQLIRSKKETPALPLRQLEKQKTRLSLSLSPQPARKGTPSDFWSSRRSVIDLETRISACITMQMCFPGRLEAEQLPLQQMSSEYQWREEGKRSSPAGERWGDKKPFRAELTRFFLGLRPPFPCLPSLGRAKPLLEVPLPG